MGARVDWLPVRRNGLRAGFVADVILRSDLSSVRGCEVGRADGTRSFLPWIAALALPDAVEVIRATALLGDLELRHDATIGVPVEPMHEHRSPGAVADSLALDVSPTLRSVADMPVSREAAAS